MAAPWVSVVVPSFNQGRFLREALDSILTQDHPHVEVLVMDAGSTDGSVDILRSYGDRVRWVSEPDGGQADAINKGFRRARGEIVAWLNSDDRYVRGAIGRAVRALAEHPRASMVYGEGDLIAEGGELLARFPATQAFDLWYLIWVSDFIMQPTVFMRASSVRAVGGLDESLHYAMDWDLWIRLAYQGDVVHVPELLAQTREYAATKTARGGFARLRELRGIMARHGAVGWPPGAIAYGLDTLRRRWPMVFGPSSAADVKAQEGRTLPRLFAPLHRALLHLIDHQIRFAQGVHRDGWVGRRAHFALPWRGEAGSVQLEGELPGEPGLFPFHLEVAAGAGRAMFERASAGPFTLSVPVPRGVAGPRPLLVTTRAARTCRMRGDPRRLAFRLVRLGFAPAASRASDDKVMATS